MFHTIPYNVDEIENFSNKIESDEYRQSYKMVANWVHKFLCRRSPLIGRGGVVCPNTQFGLTQNTIMMAVAPEESNTKESVRDITLRGRDKFIELVDMQPELVEYTAVITSFPHLKSQEGYDLIEEVQSSLKRSYVERGLMIGQFYLTCPETGIRNEKFYPLRCPEPLLVVRTMVKSDLVFLEKDPENLPYYYKKFPKNLSKPKIIAEEEVLADAC